MLPGDELGIFARQRLVTVKGDGAAIFRQAGEIGHQHMVGWRQHDQVIATILLINADDIEQVQREVHQLGVVVLRGDLRRQRLRRLAAVGVELQQAIAALFQLRLQRLVLLAALGDKFIQAFAVFRRGEEVD